MTGHHPTSPPPHDDGDDAPFQPPGYGTPGPESDPRQPHGHGTPEPAPSTWLPTDHGRSPRDDGPARAGAAGAPAEPEPDDDGLFGHMTPRRIATAILGFVVLIGAIAWAAIGLLSDPPSGRRDMPADGIELRAGESISVYAGYWKPNDIPVEVFHHCEATGPPGFEPTRIRRVTIYEMGMDYAVIGYFTAPADGRYVFGCGDSEISIGQPRPHVERADRDAIIVAVALVVGVVLMYVGFRPKVRRRADVIAEARRRGNAAPAGRSPRRGSPSPDPRRRRWPSGRPRRRGRRP